MPVEVWHGLFSKRDSELYLSAFQDSFCFFVVVVVLFLLLLFVCYVYMFL